jgi:hypothetical protein
VVNGSAVMLMTRATHTPTALIRVGIFFMIDLTNQISDAPGGDLSNIAPARQRNCAVNVRGRGFQPAATNLNAKL